MAIHYTVKARSKRACERAHNLRTYRDSFSCKPQSGNFAIEPLAADIAKDAGITVEQAIDFLMGWAEITS